MRVIFHPEFPKGIRTFEADSIRRHDPCLAFALVRVIRGQNPSLSGLWRQKKFGGTSNRAGETPALLCCESLRLNRNNSLKPLYPILGCHGKHVRSPKLAGGTPALPPQIEFTGSMSTGSETTSGNASVSISFARP
jgi:hypothetical protein